MKRKPWGIRLTVRQFIRLWRRQDGACAYCPRPLTEENATVDHLIPASRGGGGGANFVLSCDRCNKRKGDRVPPVEVIRRAAT